VALHQHCEGDWAGLCANDNRRLNMYISFPSDLHTGRCCAREFVRTIMRWIGLGNDYIRCVDIR
jgi:hypothetical protein